MSTLTLTLMSCTVGKHAGTKKRIKTKCSSDFPRKISKVGKTPEGLINNQGNSWKLALIVLVLKLIITIIRNNSINVS